MFFRQWWVIALSLLGLASLTAWLWSLNPATLVSSPATAPAYSTVSLTIPLASPYSPPRDVAAIRRLTGAITQQNRVFVQLVAQVAKNPADDRQLAVIIRQVEDRATPPAADTLSVLPGSPPNITAPVAGVPPLLPTILERLNQELKTLESANRALRHILHTPS